MADPLAPASPLNGKQNEATLDQANIAMRSMPWYQDMLKSFGQDPNNVHLTNNQKTQIVRGAQAHGFVIDEGDMHIDDSGNIDKKGHALRNTLIVAGLAGATIATMGAAGAFSGAAGGALGAGSAAGGGAAAGGTALGTTAGLGIPGVAGSIAGGTGLAGGTAATGAGIGSTLLGAAKNYMSKGQGAQGYLSTAADIGTALGANAQGRADARVVEGGMTQRQDQLAQQRYQNELNAAKLNLDAPGQRASTSVHGDILANAKPFAWGGGTDMVGNIPVPKYSGGLSPTMFSDNTRALGSQMSAQALADNGAMGGRAIGAAPGLTDLPQSGATDSILNTAGTLGNFASILGNYAPKKKPVVPVYDDRFNTGGN